QSIEKSKHVCVYGYRSGGEYKEKQGREVQESSSKRAGDELEQESSKKQKIEDENESTKLKRCLEIVPDDGDEVTIDATPLSSNALANVISSIEIVGVVAVTDIAMLAALISSTTLTSL
nr:hypothetical protein [Tanacetum cinerariifolium]